MNKAKRKCAKGTQKIGDIPGAMSREEARKVCSQMDEIRVMIDEVHRTRKCDTCGAKALAVASMRIFRFQAHPPWNCRDVCERTTTWRLEGRRNWWTPEATS